MIIKIESWQGDVRLYGKRISRRELEQQIQTAEALCDRGCGQGGDNLIPLLCRMYRWTVFSGEDCASYVYDRDTGKIYCPSFQ